jgi:membrane protein DedA with SNARE-associated domain
MEVMASVTSWLQSLQGPPAYALVFGALLASGFWLPVNEDLLVMAAAALTLQGVMDPLSLAATAWAGVLGADLLIFHWGHRFGGRLLEHRLLARAMPPSRLARMQERMRRLGPAYLALVRFAPGLRSAMLFAAGSLRIPYRQLLLFDGLAGAVELPLLIFAVRWVGGRWQDIVDALPGWPVSLGGLLVLALVAAWLARRRKRAGAREGE